jgi:hypothetical protein
MRWFSCDCGARVFFDNTVCLSCGHELGFLPSERRIVALEPREEGRFAAAGVAVEVRKCKNYAVHGICNWLVDDDDPGTLCLACSLSEVIPNQSDAENWERWFKMEAAKRRLVYSLLGLGLPVVPKSADAARGLAFEIKSDTASEHVLTGHADGRITLNLAEADPVLRETMRVQMNERYRTLLGHFRHEIGHYYWDLLIRDSSRIEDFRALFGDERRDYGEALAEYYQRKEPLTWSGDFVTKYATAHPWEDWAETFAHYLHIVDTLETAKAFGLAMPLPDPAAGPAFELLMARFVELALVLNALNRSMGLEDAYPFAIGELAGQKLRFVHDVVSAPVSQQEAA